MVHNVGPSDSHTFFHLPATQGKAVKRFASIDEINLPSQQKEFISKLLVTGFKPQSLPITVALTGSNVKAKNNKAYHNRAAKIVASCILYLRNL